MRRAKSGRTPNKETMRSRIPGTLPSLPRSFARVFIEIRRAWADQQTLLNKAVASKTKGNSAFTSRPSNYDGAIEYYQDALKCLPNCPKKKGEGASKSSVPPLPVGSGIQEVSDEEAQAIEAEQQDVPVIGSAEQERADVEEEIRECTKSCWGNLAACHLANVSAACRLAVKLL
jgi:hypothetical protein